MVYYLFVFFIVLLLYVLTNNHNPKTNLSKTPRSPKYGIVSSTRAGHKVRSRGEKIIADWLYDHNIRYVYEKKMSTYTPDFYLPDHRLIIEYYGLYNATGITGRNYREKIQQKRVYYGKLSIRYLELYQTDLCQLNSIIPKLLLRG